MTHFEKLINQTTTLEEALMLQNCLADDEASWYIEGIRYAFIKKRFGISAMQAAFMKLMLENSKAEAFKKALDKEPPAEMVSMAIRAHG